MSEGQNQRCDFLLDLLGLQQDGRQAISAPTNWTQVRPLLEVPTELDSVISSLANTCLAAGNNRQGRWHFFIGSPGNGKSAAVGQLARTLIQDRGCRVVDDNGTDIGDLSEDAVPYSLDVFEPGLGYPTVRIVQDASVVRNPYAADVDPARDLLETLAEAWSRGISLIVCTNRGVLEKAFRDTYLDPEVNRQPWHRAILRPLVESGNGHSHPSEPLAVEGRRPVFPTITVSAHYLDNRSLLLSGRRIFENLVEQAVRSDRWGACTRCAASSLCPFKANRDWLANDMGREMVVSAFRRAEVLSSQVIVFREALAAISFLLAGCARDYHNQHACDWVGDMVAADDIFGLATRRIYMCLFSASFPRGLEATSVLRSVQTEALQSILAAVPADNALVGPLTRVLEARPPSTDVGVARLLGMGGVFQRLDPLNGPLPASFFDAWDGSYELICSADSPYICEIERRCARAWDAMETTAENMPSHLASTAYWAVRRWSTQFTLHLGALSRGLALAATELDEFTELLELLWKERSERTVEERRRLRELEQLVERLLNRDGESASSVTAASLADNVQVSGRWVEQNIRPRVESSPASGSLTIAIRFGQSADHTTLAAPMYLWLRQRASGTMDRRCIPGDLMSEAMDARSRAVARSNYAFAADDVNVAIEGERERFTLARFDGEVDVDAHNKP